MSLEKVKCDKLSAFACDILSQCDVSSETATVWVCKTCLKRVKNEKIPAQALCNGLVVKEVPEELAVLCDLEVQVISLVMPFMKIVAKPRGTQRGIHGAVVLVPTQLTQITNILPRTLGQCEVMALPLKRRLSDINSSQKQYVRPTIVNAALQYLMTHNRLYKDVEVNSTWIEETKCSENENLVNEACQERSERQEEDDDHGYLIDSEDEVDGNNSADIVEEIQNKGSINNNTCMHPIDGTSVSADDVFNIAPGEGQRPISVFSEENWKAMAFPSLFPDGKGTFKDPRPVRLSARKYVNVRLMNKNSRFAESPTYIFQALHWLEQKSVCDTIQIAQRKMSQRSIAARDLKGKGNVKQFLNDDEMFATFKTIRGTPQYWKQMQLDMCAKLRQLGPYTFF